MLVVLLAPAAIRAQATVHISEVCFQGDHLAQIAPPVPSPPHACCRKPQSK
jgi:hypothetical protein